jgi:hypothetical protein
MKKTISRNEFAYEFTEYDRKDQFSDDALTAIYDYLVEMEEDSGVEIELDVIAICCEFTEYESLEDFQEYHSDIETLDDLHENTIAFEIGGGGLVVVEY